MTEKKARRGTAEELAALYPAARHVPVRVKRANGEAPGWDDLLVGVEPMTAEQIGNLASELVGIAETLAGAPNVLVLAGKHPKEIMAAVSAATNVPLATVKRMDAGGFLDVAIAVFEVNRDFFVLRLPRLLFAGTASESGDGRTLSDSSGTTATTNPNA